MTYIGLLIFLAIMALVSAATVHLGTLVHRHAAEQELLQIGSEFRNAFISYIVSTPVGTKRYPETLQDLLKDPRVIQTKRHLRNIHIDPISGNDAWGIIKSIDGTGIVGVYSLSNDRPIKVGNFDTEFIHFSAKQTYRDWRFSIEN